jgi:Tfp pilus assembly protein PilZ
MSELRSPRVPLDRAVAFSTEDLGSALRMDGVGRDISLGGMFIQTDVPGHFGERIVVYLTLPGGKRQMALPAIVRWGREDGIGVQFGELGAHDTHAVVEFMARKTSTTSS